MLELTLTVIDAIRTCNLFKPHPYDNLKFGKMYVFIIARVDNQFTAKEHR